MLRYIDCRRLTLPRESIFSNVLPEPLLLPLPSVFQGTYERDRLATDPRVAGLSSAEPSPDDEGAHFLQSASTKNTEGTDYIFLHSMGHVHRTQRTHRHSFTPTRSRGDYLQLPNFTLLGCLRRNHETYLSAVHQRRPFTQMSQAVLHTQDRKSVV